MSYFDKIIIAIFLTLYCLINHKESRYDLKDLSITSSNDLKDLGVTFSNDPKYSQQAFNINMTAYVCCNLISIFIHVI